MDILMVSGTPVTLADVGQLVADSNEFKFAIQTVALKRMLMEMKVNAEESKEESEEGSEDEAQGQAAD